MYGGDIERLLGAVNNIKDITVQQIQSLANESAYRISTEDHSHSVSDHSVADPVKTFEAEKGSSAMGFISPIVAAGSTLELDRQKMEQIQGKMSDDTKKWNNEYGSPWTEVNNLKNNIKSLETFAGSHSNLQWIGEKFALLSLMQIVLSLSIDVKTTITEYQSHIQGGYANVFNNNEPPIVWDNFKDPTGSTIGNRNQEIEENVHIKKPNPNPF